MEKTERFLLDMHMHTKETSSCGEVPAAEGVRLYKEAGSQGVMITDHYHRQYFDSLGDMDMSRKIDAYLTGCRAAWPTFVVAIPVMFLLTRHRKSFAFSAALVGCGAGAVLLDPSLLPRSGFLDSFIVRGRMPHHSSLMRMSQNCQTYTPEQSSKESTESSCSWSVFA